MQHAYCFLSSTSLPASVLWRRHLSIKKASTSLIANWDRSASSSHKMLAKDSFRKSLMCLTLSTTVSEVMRLHLSHHSWNLFGKGFLSHPVGTSSSKNIHRRLGTSTRDDKNHINSWMWYIKHGQKDGSSIHQEVKSISPPLPQLSWLCDSLWPIKCKRGDVYDFQA